jgi:hypothetical protein
MANRVTVVPPRDPWPSSTVVAKDLEALVADNLLRPLSGGAQPEWMAPSEAVPSPPPGYVVSFIPFHERGFEVLASHLEFVIPRASWCGGCSYPREWNRCPVCKGIYWVFAGAKCNRLKDLDICCRSGEPPRVLPTSKSV